MFPLKIDGFRNSLPKIYGFPGTHTNGATVTYVNSKSNCVQIRLQNYIHTTHLNGFVHFEIKLMFETPVTDSDLNKVEKGKRKKRRYL